MSTVRVKICGITRSGDACAAAEAGADAIGLVFYAKSPRAVTVPQAQAVLAALPPFVTTVGLFVDSDPAEVHRILAEVPLDLLQFHGNESAEYCDSFARPYIKALRVRPDEDVAALVAVYPNAQGILLDAFVEGVPGGTGESFDWSLIPRSLGKPLILAGGLSPANVAEAVARVQPYAVDVSGGVEASKGIKDAGKVAGFIRAARGF